MDPAVIWSWSQPDEVHRLAFWAALLIAYYLTKQLTDRLVRRYMK